MRYYIPEIKLNNLEKLIKRLSKKTTVKFEVFENDVRLNRILIADGVYATYKEVAVELEIDYKVGDYEIIAELEHHKEGNIIRAINPLYEIPTDYRTCKPYCEHCQKIRSRANTFLLLDKNNNFKQVGKNCLNDFVGYDADKVISLSTSIFNYFQRENYEDDDEFIRDVQNQRWFDTKVVANKIYQLILNEGYDTNGYKDPLRNLEDYKFNPELNSKIDEILNVVNTNWYKDTNYHNNVKIILSLECIEYKHFRILASFINSALNYLQELKVNNNWLGNVKDKIEFTIKDFKGLFNNGKFSYYSNDNITYKIKTTTDQIIIWSTEKELEVGKTYKGVIKELKEYKDVKQTVVTRCKEV